MFGEGAAQGPHNEHYHGRGFVRILTQGTRLWQTGMMEQLGMQIRNSINKNKLVIQQLREMAKGCKDAEHTKQVPQLPLYIAEEVEGKK